MPAADQENLRTNLRHRSRQLSVSMYWGPFFRDARYYLLADQPPADLDLLRNPKDEPIHPGEPLGILPAGTSIRIADIQFATAANTTARSLFSPRFSTWVLLDIPGLDKPGVLVIREEPNSQEGFTDILSRYLTTDDISPKLDSYPEEIRSAIAKKELVSGMETDAVRMAWGNPLQVTMDFEDGIKLEKWRFEGGRSLHLRNDTLVSWEP